MDDSETTGCLAALAAQFFMALGFIIWDKIWSQSGGSAYALNLYKCNLASIGFFIAGLIFGFRIAGNDDDDDDNGTVKNSNNNEILESVLFLILSGFIGIIVGDLAWLEALRRLGASKVIVLDTMKPFTAAFFGWMILGEKIQKIAFSGITLTVLGVLIVSLEGRQKRSTGTKNETERNYQSESYIEEDADVQLCLSDKQLEVLKIDQVNDNKNGELQEYGKEQFAVPSLQVNFKAEQKKDTVIMTNRSGNDCTHTSICDKRGGYVLAVANIILDTYGSILTKQQGEMFSTWTINLIRFGSSGIIMLIVSAFFIILNKLKPPSPTLAPVLSINNSCTSNTSSKVLQTRWYILPKMRITSWLKISLGVLFVTFLCPALSNYALFQLSLGLAMSLGSITPIYALFLEWPIHGEEKKPTLKSIIGALLAIVGVAILSIFKTEET